MQYVVTKTHSPKDRVQPYDIFGPRKLYRRLMPQMGREYISRIVRSADRAAFSLTGTPPRDLRSHISPAWFDFKATGRDQIEFLIQVAGLQPEDHVLDVACGVGRLAIPLSQFLSCNGRYSGFDVFVEGIAWCRDRIAAKDPRFDFLAANVRTDFRSEGTDAREYRFEYEDGAFSFCYAGSIFTHLSRAESENYLRQIHRVLKHRGRFVSTWLTYSDEAIARIPGTAARLDELWPNRREGWRFRNEQSPGESVAYEQGKIRELFCDAGLTIIEPIRPDASYNLARIPKIRQMGTHLHHCVSIVAVAE
ncbi:MAG: class I SAM-dependent methyltransferase [Amaricoccus sp.]|mgnify:CR=1 FL=1|uniref:class I SAM-dependent methyltransferase n=1 Tax=Amaricoccus sp. TaxID=1872485 RepID=UPI003314CAA9